MIIENQAMVTDAVVEAVTRVEDPRLREILQSLVRHLHGFVREVSLTAAGRAERDVLDQRLTEPERHRLDAARACERDAEIPLVIGFAGAAEAVTV